MDNGNVEKPVGPGDMTLTLKGQWHGITNTGKEPLVILAVIAKN
jgi:mannose-6-phosphate isomerase-like protein (cupin superfamily)